MLEAGGNERLLRAYRREGERRGLEPTGLVKRDADLRCFLAAVKLRATDVGRDDVLRFLDARRGRHGALTAKRRYAWISTLHCFFDWALSEELVTEDPTARIQRPKLRKSLPRPIPDADFDEALAKAPDGRMRCWLLLTALAGFRCLEISRLTREDVLESWHPPVIIAHGKGSKDRTVPLHSDLWAALDAMPMPRRGPVFVRPISGKPWSPAQVSREIALFFDDLGMPWTAHQGRHWFGTHLYQEEPDLLMVADLMGHESTSSTRIYADYNKRKAAPAVGRLSLGGQHRLTLD